MVLLSIMALTLKAKPPIPTPETDPLYKLDNYLLKTILTEGTADSGLKDVLGKDEFNKLIKEQNIKIFNGPMLGNVTDMGAQFWVRTLGDASVQIVLDEKFVTNKSIQTDVIKTSKNKDFTGIMTAKGLKADTRYSYYVLLNGEAVHKDTPFDFKTAPSKGSKRKITIAFGGGARHNAEKEYMWDTIAKRNPDAFLFLGDNLYIDDREGFNRHRVYYYRRYLRPEFKRMSASTAIYSIWDDHDFGVNDESGGTDKYNPAWKLPVWEIFKENWINPYYGGGKENPGCWFDFNIGDVDFFMTDGRYYRDFKKGTMLGDVQKKWLIEKIKASKATFKVIVSGTLWTEHADKKGKDSWWGVPKEREEVLSVIDEEKIGGVILLSADRHRTDVYKLERPNGYTLYEFETSKLTNNHTHPTKPKALFSYNKGNYYGHFTFDFTKSDPEATFKCITIDDKEVYSLTLKRSQLQKKK